MGQEGFPVIPSPSTLLLLPPPFSPLPALSYPQNCSEPHLLGPSASSSHHTRSPPNPRVPFASLYPSSPLYPNPLSPLTSHPPSSKFLPTHLLSHPIGAASHTLSRLLPKQFFPSPLIGQSRRKIFSSSSPTQFFPPLSLVNPVVNFSRPPLLLSSAWLSPLYPSLPLQRVPP